MFTVEWLKDGKAIESAPMIGESVADVLAAARGHLPRIEATTSISPDTIRIIDRLRNNQTTIEKIGTSDAKRS